MAKARMTVFSRFILTMLVVAPLAFLGANYATGKDGLQELKNLFNFGQPVEQVSRENPKEETAQADPIIAKELRKAKEDLKYKDERIKELRRKNEDLQVEVAKLKSQLENGG